MAIVLGKKKAAAAPAQEEEATPAPAAKLSKPSGKITIKPKVIAKPEPEEEVEEEQEEEVEAEEPAEEEEEAPKKTLSITGKKKETVTAPKLSFLKRGDDAEASMKKETVKVEQKQARNAVRRFWMPKNSESKITFLDGTLDKKGRFLNPALHQHSVFMNNSYNNHFICTQDNEPCPICEGGDEYAWTMLFTVINHDEWKSKDGKVYKDQVQLYVAKRNSVIQLTKMAEKRGGSLAGCTYDVARTGDKEPSIGNSFEFDQKNSLADLAKAFGTKDKTIAPFDYDKVCAQMYLSAKDLRALGFGNTSAPVGSEPAPTEDYEKNL